MSRRCRFPSESRKRRIAHGQGRLMATQIVNDPLPPAASHVGHAGGSTLLRSLTLMTALFVCAIPAHAQLQSAFVFAADPANPKSVSVYTRNDVTGILTPVAGSPFPSKEPVNVMTLDFKGRFLFTASYNPSKISMFVVDPNTGALQEVLNSPFASLSTNDPVFLSTESSGQFLCVINFNGSQPNVSSVESFQIDPVNLGLIPSSSGASQLPGLFLSGATHPSGKSFYAFLNAPHASIPNEAFFLLFDSSTGKFTIPNHELKCGHVWLLLRPRPSREKPGAGRFESTDSIQPPSRWDSGAQSRHWFCQRRSALHGIRHFRPISLCRLSEPADDLDDCPHLLACYAARDFPFSPAFELPIVGHVER